MSDIILAAWYADCQRQTWARLVNADTTAIADDTTPTKQ